MFNRDYVQKVIDTAFEFVYDKLTSGYLQRCSCVFTGQLHWPSTAGASFESNHLSDVKNSQNAIFVPPERSSLPN